MHWGNVLIVLGCLAAGYWLVSSIMSPGVDLTRPPKSPDTEPAPALPVLAPNPHASDWHLILDVPLGAHRREVESAYKRRLAQAEASGDTLAIKRIRLAYEASARRPA
jgi:hypothetical protein